MPTTADDPEFDALLQACAQQPASRVLLTTMMAEATRVGAVARAVAYLQDDLAGRHCG